MAILVWQVLFIAVIITNQKHFYFIPASDVTALSLYVTLAVEQPHLFFCRFAALESHNAGRNLSLL